MIAKEQQKQFAVPNSQIPTSLNSKYGIMQYSQSGIGKI